MPILTKLLIFIILPFSLLSQEKLDPFQIYCPYGTNVYENYTQALLNAESCYWLKIYNQDYNINTPINLELQKIATQSLRNGLVAYDRRKGWRGPIKNIKYSKDWYKNIEKKFKLEKSIDWQIVIVKKINQFN